MLAVNVLVLHFHVVSILSNPINSDSTYQNFNNYEHFKISNITHIDVDINSDSNCTSQGSYPIIWKTFPSSINFLSIDLRMLCVANLGKGSMFSSRQMIE